MGRTLDELAEKNSLAVVYLRAKGELPIEAELAHRCQVVEEVPWPGAVSSFPRYARLAWAWIRGYPMWAQDWEVPKFRERLRELIGKWRPNLVQFEYHIMAQYLEEASAQPTLLVQHEPGSAAAADRYHASRGWKRWVLGRDFQSWTAYEAVQEKFGTVVCFTEEDRRSVLGVSPSARVAVIAPRGPAIRSARPASNTFEEKILFAGNFKHPPNVDAAIRLVRGILPKVLLRHPQAVVQLVGDGPPAELRRLAGSNVTVTGRVADVGPYLDAAGLIAVPLRLGGGIRIKVMDALASGKPVVSSKLAANGLDLTDRQEILLAETDEAFAEAIDAILSEAELRERLSAAARAWAATFSASGRVGLEYERLYSALGARTASIVPPKS